MRCKCDLNIGWTALSCPEHGIDFHQGYNYRLNVVTILTAFKSEKAFIQDRDTGDETDEG